MVSLAGEKVLVTGAAGFIGSHVVEHLATLGASVRAFVRYNSAGAAGWLDDLAPDVRASVEVVFGDVRDAESVRAAAAHHPTILHLAALISIPYSYQAPRSYIDVNATGTLNVVLAARETGARRLVVTSTSEVYGTAQTVPIVEEHRLKAQSPYAASKIAADQIALSGHAAWGVPATILRPFNAYGPRQSTRAVIPSIMTQIASGKRRIRLGSLSPTRDFSFVRDVAAGFAAAAASEEGVGEVVNIGSGFEISIADTAKAIAAVMGATVEVEADPARFRPAESEVERLFAGAEKARRLFGWTPLYGGRDGFEKGLVLTAEWFQNPRNLERFYPGLYRV